MLDVQAGRPLGDQFVAFRAMGDTAQGPHRCSGCGYGISVYADLPRCPMCGGETWEPVVARRSATGAPAH